MIDVVGRAIGLEGDGLACTAEVLSHKPGQRCTIEYTLSSPGRSGSTTVVGKLYGRPRLAARVFGWAKALSERAAAAPLGARVPAPLALEPEIGLVLQKRVPGTDIRGGLEDGSARPALVSTARWLAAFHASPPLSELRPKPLEHELAKLDSWCSTVRPCLTARESARLDRARERLHEHAGTMERREPRMIHRDLYYAHVLWDGQRAWILDLDQLSLGDPALDVGHFLGHLENLALRVKGQPDAYRRQGAAFLAAYREHAGKNGYSALSFYRSYTLLKLAATEVERRRGRWLLFARGLARLGCRVGNSGDERQFFRSGVS